MNVARSWMLLRPIRHATDTDVGFSGADASDFIPCTSTSSRVGVISRTMVRMAEESPTRASVRATTREAMLNTISDRIQQSHEQRQALNDETNNGNATRQYQIDHLNTQEDKLSGEIATKDSLKVQIATRPLSKLCYEISTLIALGEGAQDSSEILLKVKPEAVAENLFQYIGIDRSCQPATRSRGLFNMSNLLRRSAISSNGVDEWEPSRQPRVVLEASNLQQHEGFARFLKQHASPPHQRVTAGGRIVPTGPSSPPPMFDYASLTGLVEGQQTQLQARNHPKSSRIQTYDFPRGSNTPPFPSHQVFGPQMLGPAIAQETQNYFNMSASLQQPAKGFVASVPPSSFTFIPLGVFPDGTALISCNGVCYRSYWNGVTTVMDPITTGQSVTVSDTTAAYPPAPLEGPSYGTQYHGSIVPPVPHSVPFPTTGGSTLPATYNLQPLNQRNTPPPGEVVLKGQLSILDKLMALHHYEIGPAEKSQMVAQRKSLVESIAKLRNDREPVKPSIPIVTKSNDASRKSSTQASMTSHFITANPQPEQDSSYKTSTYENTSFKKVLSPSAPAFVPNNAMKPFPSDLALGPVPKRSAAVLVTKPSMEINSTSISNGISSKVTSAEVKLREASSSSDSQPYIEFDLSDPAMRIVTSDMLEYAQKYNTDSTGVAKKFCTTKEEFQEAIRRVREQARFSGCVGGNSKDPAYDAEEDIWYAIKDKYPIPLPTKVPDHITCPRPWNWYDSAFNVNATIKPQNYTRGDFASPVQHFPTDRCSTSDQALQPTEKTCRNSAPKPTILKQQNDNPLMEQCCKTLPYQSRNAQQRSSSMQSHAMGNDRPDVARNLESTGTWKAAATIHNPHKEPGYDNMRDQHEPLNSQIAIESNSNHPNLHDLIQRRNQVSQRRTAFNLGSVPPSPTALSAAQAAFGSKTSASACVFPGPVADCSENPKRISSKHSSDKLFGSHYTRRNLKQGGRSSSQKPHSPPTSSLQRHGFHRPTLAMTGITAYGATDEYSNMHSSNSSGNGKLANESTTCSPSYEGADCKVCSPRSAGTKKPNDTRYSLSAESKATWGPEQLCAAFAKSGVPKVNIPKPALDSEAESQTNMKDLRAQRIQGSSFNEEDSRARWEIPYLQKIADNTQVPSAHEVQSEDVTSILDVKSDTLLKHMLKDPRYSLNSLYNDVANCLPDDDPQNDNENRDNHFWAQKAEAKKAEDSWFEDMPQPEGRGFIEQIGSSAHGSMSSNIGATSMLNKHAATAREPSSKFSPATQKSPALNISKASCSLASSAYQARGYLPPYDGAGKARTSSIHHKQPNPRSQSKFRVNLPLSSPHIQYDNFGDDLPHHPSDGPDDLTCDTRYIPTLFGYDGSGDLATSDDLKTAKGKGKHQECSSPDYKTVTTADFDRHRPTHNNEWHRGAVNDFFHDLHEKEVRKMMERQRKNIKTAP